MQEIRCPKCGEVFQVDESGYDQIAQQVRDREFEKELDRRKKELDAQREQELEIIRLQEEKEHTASITQKDAEISEKDQKIAELQAKLDASETAKKLAVAEAIEQKNAELSQKATEIADLKGELKNKATESRLSEKSLQEQYEEKLKLKDEQIEYYKDFKARQSTKMISESLEQHCLTQFNAIRMTAFPNAYFEKDNEVVEGSKGDFVFRDFTEEGMEYISIMFEMKNEADSTAEKHRNSDFFEKLHKDRNRKKCEYAVLVSMLESDSERYNAGIVEVPQYEKMYVVRPQCFLPIIQILRDVARRTIEDRKALIAERNKNIDITNFEEELISFKTRFGQNILNSQKKFQEAIDAIDKSIKDLVKVKEALNLSIKHLGAADNKLEDLTIRKLTRNNPTMKGLFEEARALKEKTEAEEVEGELD